MRHEEEDEQDNKENWPVVRDLLAQVIEPSKSWADATCLRDLSGICELFTNAFPGVQFTQDNMKMALHDLNIDLERNEHNNKFYYLAQWR